MFLPSKLSLKCFTVFWSGFLRKKHLQMSQYTADTVCFFTNDTKENLIAQLFVELESSAWSHIKDN